jgi:hypothetical protein
MSQSFKLSRRIARLRALLSGALVFSLVGCDETDSLNPESSVTPETIHEVALGDAAEAAPAAAELVPAGDVTTASATFAGGIPIGMSAQPLTAFGSRYNGSKLTVSPAYLMQELSAVRSRGGRVFIMLAGNHRYWVNSDGSFSFTKWKARVDRFKNMPIASYINDGTIIGHFMMDEPNDPANWRGHRVTPAQIEEMARYSKQVWPGMATIIRTQPDYLASNHRYLDAAWAQYLHRRGNAAAYIKEQVADAQARGLALVVGLNVLKGGNPNGTPMSASEVEEWGSALLSSNYPCAFVSWQYNSNYLSSSGIGGAMDALRRKAQSRPAKSCRA